MVSRGVLSVPRRCPAAVRRCPDWCPFGARGRIDGEIDSETDSEIDSETGNEIDRVRSIVRSSE
eukprot:5555130-Pyramimonas_sp.AAC.1